MLGLAVLGLTVLMIYTLVKNALLGKQLTKEDGLTGAMELIIPMTAHSTLYAETWKNTFRDNHSLPPQVKIHFLLDGHHPCVQSLQELQSLIPNIEVHSFPLRPSDVDPVLWMIDQVSSKISAPIIIIGDSEIVPTANAFAAIGKLVATKNRSLFVLPQTARVSLLGESIAAINPTLAFTSFFGHKKWRRKITNSFAKISEGWMAMTYETFTKLDLRPAVPCDWKELVITHWQKTDRSFSLAFGEKYLKRHYPDNLIKQLRQMTTVWDNLWNRTDRTGFGLYLTILFIWSFPVICFPTHPYWSIASFFLLILYRFFSKIVFQESWIALFLHPFGCIAWIGSLIWWIGEQLKDKYQARKAIT